MPKINFHLVGGQQIHIYVLRKLTNINIINL